VRSVVRHLHHGVRNLLDLNDRPFRIDDPVPDHGIHLDRHVVARDSFLLLDIGRDRPQVELGLPFHEWPDEIEAGTGAAVEAAEPEHDASFILIGDPNAHDDEHDDRNTDNDKNQGNEVQDEHGRSLGPTGNSYQCGTVWMPTSSNIFVGVSCAQRATLLLPCVISRAARWLRAWIQTQLRATLRRLRRPIRK
jgi:hypothetical protein